MTFLNLVCTISALVRCALDTNFFFISASSARTPNEYNRRGLDYFFPQNRVVNLLRRSDNDLIHHGLKVVVAGLSERRKQVQHLCTPPQGLFKKTLHLASPGLPKLTHIGML